MTNKQGKTLGKINPRCVWSNSNRILKGSLYLHLPQNHRALPTLLFFQVLSSYLPWLWSLDLICIPKVSSVNYHILWGCHAPLKTHVSKWIFVPFQGPGHPNEPLHPFMDVISPNEPTHSSTIIPFGIDMPTLGATLMLACHNIVVTSYLDNIIGTSAWPRHLLAHLGC